MDTYLRFASGFLQTAKTAVAAATTLTGDIRPLYGKWARSVEAILIGDGTAFGGGKAHSYGLYLELSDIAAPDNEGRPACTSSRCIARLG